MVKRGIVIAGLCIGFGAISASSFNALSHLMSKPEVAMAASNVVSAATATPTSEPIAWPLAYQPSTYSYGFEKLSFEQIAFIYSSAAQLACLGLLFLLEAPHYLSLMARGIYDVFRRQPSAKFPSEELGL